MTAIEQLELARCVVAAVLIIAIPFYIIDIIALARFIWRAIAE